MPHQTRRERRRRTLRHHSQRHWHHPKQPDPNLYERNEHYPGDFCRRCPKRIPCQRKVYPQSNLLRRHHGLRTKRTRFILYSHRAFRPQAIPRNRKQQAFHHSYLDHPPTQVRCTKRPAARHFPQQDHGSKTRPSQTATYCTTHARTLHQIRTRTETRYPNS